MRGDAIVRFAIDIAKLAVFVIMRIKEGSDSEKEPSKCFQHPPVHAVPGF